jgi:hypothetical protein
MENAIPLGQGLKKHGFADGNPSRIAIVVIFLNAVHQGLPADHLPDQQRVVASEYVLVDQEKFRVYLGS